MVRDKTFSPGCASQGRDKSKAAGDAATALRVQTWQKRLNVTKRFCALNYPKFKNDVRHSQQETGGSGGPKTEQRMFKENDTKKNYKILYCSK